MFENVDFPLPENWSDTPDKYMDRNTNPKRWMEYWKPGLPEMKRVYYAMVASIDEYMGQLMKKMDELGISENTIVVFTSDHGEMFGENGRVYKMIFYESSARVPFIVRWPQKIANGKETDACINTPDIMPTLLSMMGMKKHIPAEVEGMNLSKITLGKTGSEPKMAFLQGMGHTYQWKDGHEWRAVRSKQYTYARYLIDGKELLFDNSKDPLQMNNQADSPVYEKVKKEMKTFMDKKMLELNDEFKPCSWYRDNWVDENRSIIRAAKGKF